MFFVYILYSSSFDRYYVGQTNNLDNRLKRHNSGYVKSTKAYVPWNLVYHEEFKTRKESMNRESYLKRLKSSKSLKNLLDASR